MYRQANQQSKCQSKKKGSFFYSPAVQKEEEGKKEKGKEEGKKREEKREDYKLK